VSDHNEVVERIKRHFEKDGFDAQTRGNNLPVNSGRNGSIYRPDIIVRKNGQIVWLVEVETGEGGKSLAGAAVLADACMEKMQVKNKPNLLFVFYRSETNLDLAKKRLDAIGSRVKFLRILPPATFESAMKSLPMHV
jgi:hypothetical protein